MEKLFKADRGKYPILLAHYKKRLEYLSDHLGSEYVHPWFEMLQQNAPYRAMRFCKVKFLGNLRILYCVADHCAWLLTAFQEKKTGTDYQRPLEIAKQRVSELHL